MRAVKTPITAHHPLRIYPAIHRCAYSTASPDQMTNAIRRGTILLYRTRLDRRENSLRHVFVWWLLTQILGLAALPLAHRLFKWLPGRGYAFAKPLGLLLTAYILWLGATLGFLRNTGGSIVVALVITAGLSLWLYDRRREDDDQSLAGFVRSRWRLILTVEILFAVSFGAWAILRAYAPDKIMSAGGEKWMEIAFLSAILESPTFPPQDPWLSGFAISYYYFSYVMMALVTRLSGVVATVGFELYNALIFALTVTGAFGVVNSLVATRVPGGSGEQHPLRYGLLGSFFVAVMGNLEGLLEALYARGLLSDGFWGWIDIPDLISAGRVTGSFYPGHGWWWWRASRVIRDRNLLGGPMPLNPIAEFPFFSFLLGDNHPHVMTLPFVLLAIALALNLLRRPDCGHEPAVDAPAECEGNAGSPRWWNPAGYCLAGDWFLFGSCALAIGALGFLNTWDLPIYLGLVVLAYGVGRWSSTDETVPHLLGKMLVLGIGLGIVGALLYLPFYISFSSQAGGVLPHLLSPTRLPQYLVMFGPFIFVAAWFLGAQLWTMGDRKRALGAAVRSWLVVVAAPFVMLLGVLSLVLVTESGRQFLQGVLSDPTIQQLVSAVGPGPALRAILIARLRDPWLFLILSLLIALSAVVALQPWNGAGRKASTSSSSDRFAALLFLCGLSLTFIPEFAYLRDSFGVRMNTIFKFYYQGWVLMGCASAYGVWWLLASPQARTGRGLRVAFLAGTVLLAAAGLVYPVMASYSRVRGFEPEPSLDGAVNVARNHPDDWAAIEWLQANTPGTSVILEAPGLSYNYEGRMSAFTGRPAVLGWALHQSQWRGSYVEQGKREPDIKTIYTTREGRQALDLLHKWDVDYVIVGPPERRYTEDACRATDPPCNAAEALSKFDMLLHAVFSHGQTTIYRVPAP